VARRVFLHVGLPKSGTTFLQAALVEHKQKLMHDADLLFPGESWMDQVRAVRDVRHMRGAPRGRASVRGAWRRLAKEICDWPGDAVVSMEWLARAKPDQIRRVVDDLQPAEVEVVFTVRDLGRTIPASWQESVQNRHGWSWEEFVAALVADADQRDKPRRMFWNLHDLLQLMPHWLEAVPPDRVHVVTVPGPASPSTLLWERFCEVLGVDSSGYNTEGLTKNEMLGLESVELIRRLNPHTRGIGMSDSTYKLIFSRGLAKSGLALRDQPQSRVVLPPERHAWVRERAAEDVEFIEEAKVRVVGDLADLEPVLPAEASRGPEEIGDDELLDIALDAMVILGLRGEASLRAVRESRERAEIKHAEEVRELTRQNARLTRQNDRMRSRLSQLGARPIRTALGVYGHRHPRVVAVLGRRPANRRRTRET